MAVSKKDRFEIFKRDNFRCVYCGKQPPEVTLVLEHITPKAKGGQDVFENYCTSCVECNQGKAANLLNQVPPSVVERLAYLQERLEEVHALKAQSEMAALLKKEKDAIQQRLCDRWCTSFGVDECNRSMLSGMMNRLRWIPIDTMFELIDACAKKTSHNSEYKQNQYMYGCLRTHLSQLGIDYKKEVGAA